MRTPRPAKGWLAGASPGAGAPASRGQGGSGPRAPPARGWGVGRGGRGAGRWQMKGAASAARKFAPGRAAGLAYRRPRPLRGGRAPDATAAATAPAPGGGPGRSHARPGPGAFSGRRGRARLRRGGRAVIRVIARLPAGCSSGPRCAALAPGAGGGRGSPQPVARQVPAPLAQKGLRRGLGGGRTDAGSGDG